MHEQGQHVDDELLVPQAFLAFVGAAQRDAVHGDGAGPAVRAAAREGMDGQRLMSDSKDGMGLGRAYGRPN